MGQRLNNPNPLLGPVVVVDDGVCVIVNPEKSKTGKHERVLYSTKNRPETACCSVYGVFRSYEQTRFQTVFGPRCYCIVRTALQASLLIL